MTILSTCKQINFLEILVLFCEIEILCVVKLLLVLGILSFGDWYLRSSTTPTSQFQLL